MTIEKKLQGNTLEIALTGRLDTTTAPELEKEARNALTGITNLIIDLAELEYISSAGLRVLLSMQKIMSKQGEMVVRGATEAVREVFDITGFSSILTLE